MQKLTWKLDCSIFCYKDLINYLTSLKGINLVKIDNDNSDIYVEYDSDIISLKIWNIILFKFIKNAFNYWIW